MQTVSTDEPTPLVADAAEHSADGAVEERRDIPRPRADDRVGALGVAILTVAALALFIDKPLHIDDPFYLWVAEHLIEKPLDFFGLTVNWYGVEQPLADVNQNPPLVSYWLALAISIAGQSEITLHSAMILPAVAVVLGVWALARRFGYSPLLAAVTTLAMPVFLVSATTVMSDVLMLAFYVWCIFFWTRGLEERRRSDLLVAGILVAAATLTKYFGVTLFPLLVAHGLLERRRPGLWLSALLVPVACLAAYEAWAVALYGHGLFTTAATYAVRNGGNEGHGLAGRCLLGVIYGGGCVVPLLGLLPLLGSRREVAARVVAIALVVSSALAIGSIGAVALSESGVRRWDRILHAALFGAAGATLVTLPLFAARRLRDPRTAVLVLWALGTLAFACVVNWTTNGRAMLPLAPALALLVAREIAECRAPLVTPRRAWLAAPLAAGLCLSLLVAHGDRALARSAEEAAAELHERHGSAESPLWFQGHWGFQHYMQERGARPVDFVSSELQPGELIVIPGNNSNVLPARAENVEFVDMVEIPVDAVVATMSRAADAGFYTSMWGPFPWTIGEPPVERYAVIRVKRPFRFAAPAE